MMKFNFTKEWCIRMAQLDQGEDFRAGAHFTQGEIIASMLKAAYQEGWQNAIDSEFVGDEAQNDRFNQSETLALCISFEQGELDQSAAPADSKEGKL